MDEGECENTGREFVSTQGGLESGNKAIACSQQTTDETETNTSEQEGISEDTGTTPLENDAIEIDFGDKTSQLEVETEHEQENVNEKHVADSNSLQDILATAAVELNVYPLGKLEMPPQLSKKYIRPASYDEILLFMFFLGACAVPVGVFQLICAGMQLFLTENFHINILVNCIFINFYYYFFR